MKKTMKILSFIAILLGIVMLSNTSKAFGLTGSTVSAKPGDTVVVTFTTTGVSSSSSMEVLEIGSITVNGDATVTTTTMPSEGSGYSNVGMVSASFNPATTSNKSYTVSVKVGDTASGTITVKSSGYIDDQDSDSHDVSATATINVKEDTSSDDVDSNDTSGSTTLSSNAKLSSLSGDFTLSQSFSPTTYEYKTTVSGKDKLAISFKGQEDGITYKITGNSNFEEGTNIVTITITAPDGKTTQAYKITVTKLVDEEEEEEIIPNVLEEEEEEEEEEVEEEIVEEIQFGLRSLIISGVQLSPLFDIDILEYTATYVGDSDFLEIMATVTVDGSEIEVTGNEELVYGENTIIVRVTGANGEELEYTIILTKEEAEEEVLETAGEVDMGDGSFWSEYKYDVMMGILSATLVGLIIALGTDIYDSKKANRDPGNDIDEDDEEEDEELKASMSELLKSKDD